MLVLAILSVVCSAATIFYLRFLIALCSDCRTGSGGYWVRLHLHSHTYSEPTEGPTTRRLRSLAPREAPKSDAAGNIMAYKQSFLGFMLYNRFWFHKDLFWLR